MAECPNCYSDPCQCSGKRSESKQSSTLYVTRKCEHPGCRVQIRYPAGTVQNFLCKWCQEGRAWYCQTCGPGATEDARMAPRAIDVSPVIPQNKLEAPGITLEEFGVDLYECIRTISQAQLLQSKIQYARKKQFNVQAEQMLRAQAAYIEKIRGLMGRLSDQQAGEVALRYPWVAML